MSKVESAVRDISWDTVAKHVQEFRDALDKDFEPTITIDPQHGVFMAVRRKGSEVVATHVLFWWQLASKIGSGASAARTTVLAITDYELRAKPAGEPESVEVRPPAAGQASWMDRLRLLWRGILELLGGP